MSGFAGARRDKFLGSAALIAAIGALLGAIVALSRFVSALEHYRAAFGVARGLQLFGSVILVVGFVVVGLAFHRHPSQRIRLRAGALLLGAAFASTAAGTGVRDGFSAYAIEDRLIAALAAGAAGSFLLGVGAVIAAFALRRSQRRLAYAAIVVAGAAAFFLVGQILELIEYSELRTTALHSGRHFAHVVIEAGRITVGLRLGAIGEGIALLGALVAAVAFMRVRQRDPYWVIRRDGLLAVTMGALSLSFLLAAIESFVINTVSVGEALTLGWLTAFNELALLAAAGTACIGLLHRRARLAAAETRATM
jgi:hypothetical protein